MSTSAVIPNASTSAVLPIKNEVVTFAVVVRTDAEGKIIPKSVRHTSSEKDIATLEHPNYGKNADGSVNPDQDEQIAFKQAVLSPKAGTVEGFEQLVPDADERLNIINKGISSKFNQKIRTALIELDSEGNLAFQPTDATYDATPLIQEPALRTNMTPLDKAMKVLGGLDPATLAAIMAQFQAANAGTESAE